MGDGAVKMFQEPAKTTGPNQKNRHGLVIEVEFAKQREPNARN
jgi:hypothetical protein